MDNDSRTHFHLETTADVTSMWRSLIQPLGWDQPTLYVVMVDQGRVASPAVLAVDEMPEKISVGDAEQFMAFFASLIGGDGFEHVASVALLTCRPGSGVPDDSDRASCDRLYRAARTRGVPLEVIHVGTDTAITPAPMDEVAGAA